MNSNPTNKIKGETIMRDENTVCVMSTLSTPRYSSGDVVRLYHNRLRRASTDGNSIRPLDWRDTRLASAVFYIIGTAVFAACAWAFTAR